MANDEKPLEARLMVSKTAKQPFWVRVSYPGNHEIAMHSENYAERRDAQKLLDALERRGVKVVR